MEEVRKKVKGVLNKVEEVLKEVKKVVVILKELERRWRGEDFEGGVGDDGGFFRSKEEKIS